MAKIHTGEPARVIVNEILVNVADDGTYPHHGGEVGYFQDEGGRWVAWDNSTCDCWVEEFDTEEQAERYALDGIIDTY